jgi:hypothetical protein
VADYNKAHPRPKASTRIIGVDGEGQGRGPHVFNFLAAADEFGKHWEIGDDPKRQLTTQECFDFFLGLPSRSLVFSFSFLYDLTKALTDLPDRLLYLLFHPHPSKRISYPGRVFIDKRGHPQYRPVKWHGYAINYMHRRFTLSKGNRRVTIWDIFAFFQSKFTKACIDWKVGNKAAIEAMERMKDKRSSFDAQSWEEVKAYCHTEVDHLAKLGRALISAHEDADIPLTQFYGAGSTGGALLKKHNVQDFIAEPPDAMKEAVASAFFGGRFENSVIGAITRPVWNYDISSAYPYAQTQLPCLIHGRWRRCKRNQESEIERSALALIKWHLPKGGDAPWGPLPVRREDGTIVFPLAATSGWCWKKEFLAARRLVSRLAIVDVWTYQTDCQCRPFGFLPSVYLERLRIGKEGKGNALKLGANSGYGKLVQSVGFNPPFQSFVYGGNITSSCRAQCLDAIRVAPHPENILMIATDGIWADTELKLPKPINTGTNRAIGPEGEDIKKPLGGWEMKHFPGGVFAARPGIYFPLGKMTEEAIEKFRARGLGRRVLYENAARIIEAYENEEMLLDDKGRVIGPGVTIRGGQRFIGAKSGVTWTKKGGAKRSAMYGEWVDWSVNVSFDPEPKRPTIRADNTLACWDWVEEPTVPYGKAMRSIETELMKLAQLIAEEQPDADYVEV